MAAPLRSSKLFVQMGAVAALVAFVSFVGGLYIGAHDTNGALVRSIPFVNDGLNASPDESVNLAGVWKAWHTLDDKFVETHASSTIPETKEKIWGLIAGLTASYGDPYTVFFPPSEAKVFQENIAGNFGGVGIELGVNKEGILTVIAPLKGTPAERAGVRAGDLIVSIDEKPTDGMSTDEAVHLIRGEKGTSVAFVFAREGKPVELTITRDTIQVPTIDASYDAKSGVYTIALYSFTQNSGQLFSNALATFRASGATKLIIDLRGNPGGYLESAVNMASHFLPKGGTVVTEDYKGKQENIVHESLGTGGIPAGTKVVILIDQGSASASEILAGALQDAKIATLIGTRSFGKGSVQELVDIDGGSLKVTVARWLTPSGRSISDGGLIPDIKVERTQQDFTAGKDPQKDRAIQFLTTGK